MRARTPFPRLFTGALAGIIFLGYSLSHVAGELPEGQVLSVSPDNMFELRRLPADSGERGEARKELEITVHGRVAYRWTSPIGATSVLWSPESKYLAVNDAPGVQGDQLMVFSLDPMNSSVTALREPNGEKLRTEVESRHGSFLSRVEGVSLRAMDWRQDRLWCKVSGIFTPKRQSGVHVPFHYLWVLQVDGGGVPSLVEEWTLTDPRERSYRDEIR